MRFINIFFYTVFIAVLLGIAGLLVGSMLPIPGNIEIKIVKSGSMEPNIPTGAVVIVKPESAYLKGDVITFGKDTKTDIPTTHRIIASAGEGTGTTYTTKGDANEEQDPTQVVARDVIGKVVFSLPYAGFILDFARQPLGFGLLIGVPAALVILEESLTIFKEARAALRRRKRGGGDDDIEVSGGGRDEDGAPLRMMHARRYRMDEIFVPMFVEPGIFHKEWWHKNLRMHKDAYGTSTALVLGLVFMSTLFAGASGGTIAYFSDIERSIGNIFRAGVWADPQDIVLNEFLPFPDASANGLDFGNDASNEPDGEWVELYNNGNVPLDLADWYLSDESGGLGNQQAVISGGNTDTDGTIIPAHGWLVIYFNKPVLNNTGDTIFLYTDADVLVDSYTYDNPSTFCEFELTPGAANAGSGSGVPGNGNSGDCNAALVAPNKSYARIPDGTGAFVDPIPTPGGPNIADPAPTEARAENSEQPEGEVLGESTDTPPEEPEADPPPEDTTPPETTPEDITPPEPESGQTPANEPISPLPSEPIPAPTENSSEPPADTVSETVAAEPVSEPAPQI
ncbi:signal peptidase I [Candidatus Kaiserbacteria bacterium RIFCSPHIGHO2_01_FULL_56_24]|uniref:Signal peptidase I n=1 Tax=Candidatus Kaiserbacteria bacterium RIFCSPHIGHO2_01_FULL_56_24 TaxID=1798487 RepID=A0A1F6DGY6_9BACT|nr:MAG: signal peptidase I [Candidatus Kaiserbacteria bacterium RIFCSPHIGHO2_01_FULL_56_24]